MFENAKRAAAMKASESIQDGMCVGLGTGSTAAYFIQALGQKKLEITCVATSTASEQLARSYGLEVVSLDDVSDIDITVDGADEVDTFNRLIKGLGGALLREKIVAYASKQVHIVVDSSKVVSSFGKTPLPIEILPFGHRFTCKKLESIGCAGTLRVKNEKLFVTDNGNYIYDTILSDYRAIDEIERRIRSIPGVIETGYFDKIASKIFIGNEDGTIQIRG